MLLTRKCNAHLTEIKRVCVCVLKISPFFLSIRLSQIKDCLLCIHQHEIKIYINTEKELIDCSAMEGKITQN